MILKLKKSTYNQLNSSKLIANSLPFNHLGLLLILFVSTFYVNAQSRKVINLNEGWGFTLNNEIEYLSLNTASWQEIDLPHTWNNKDLQSGKKVHYGTAWYKKELNIKKSNEDKAYFIKFDGVGQYAEVYINNKYVGQHLGSFSAFTFNITDFIDTNKTNTLLVKVNNELNDSYPRDNFLFGLYGGIYRGVSLITTNNVHIGLTDYASNGIYVNQKEVSTKKAILQITHKLKNETSVKKKITIKNSLFTKEGKLVAQNSFNKLLYPSGLTPISMVLNVKKPRLWNGKKDPYLYTLKTELIYADKVFDEVEQSLGIRYFSIDPEKGFILNGEPYRLYGVNRHQEWEDFGNALLPEHHKRDMELMNEMGVTSIRLAHYQQAEDMYRLADEMGILIWAEIPFINGYKENADSNAKQQMVELIKQNYNHASIFVWGVHNEVIKLKEKIVYPQVNLTKELHNLAKTLDPDRYTVSVSNLSWMYDHPIHENTDLQGFNQYTGWYGGKATGLEKWISDYHFAKPDISLSISEYGAGGNIAHQLSDVYKKHKALGQFFPEGYHTYYHETTYTAIKNASFIWGSYVWNMFDFSVPEWDRGGIKGRNHKGLVTYDRKTKKDAFYWYKANWSKKPVLYLTGRRNDSIIENTLNIKAYSNIGAPELFINGKKQDVMHQGISGVQFVLQNVPFEKGDNKVQVKVITKERIYKDEFVLNVNTKEKDKPKN